MAALSVKWSLCTSRYAIFVPYLGRRFLSIREKEAQYLLDEVYYEIRAQRFEDIVVIQTKFNADPRYIILANAFNPRHLIKGTEMVNKQYKNTIKKVDQEFAELSISQEWNVIDFKSIVVHLFSKECRQHFDIDQLWAVGEKYDAASQQCAEKRSG